MSISFIITTCNVAARIGQCLDSLRTCLRPGDQVILVDDGSADATADIVAAFMAQGGFGPDIIWTPLWLGTRTFGGIGIAANIGLDQVCCETVFFVDGNDDLIADAFLRARQDHQVGGADIHLVDHVEFDQQTQQTRAPADRQNWDMLERALRPEDRRLAAIGLTAAPWGKFYRADFLRQNRIRFPEGDFFFEDHPFHWQVCLAAQTIGFSRRIVCHHRVNRPDQTMGGTGIELTAYFTHFRTILSYVADSRPDLRVRACHWLLENMRWHLPRLGAAAFMPYAVQAEAALKLISDEDWAGSLMEHLSSSAIGHYADRLRAGYRWDVIEAWKADAARQSMSVIMQEIAGRLNDLERRVQSADDMLVAQRAAAEFAAMQRLNAGPRDGD